MSETEIACALSHQLIYQEILHRNLEAAIILEDDAIVDERFFDFYWLNKNFSYDLLLLHYSKAIVSRFEKLKLGRDMVAHRSLVSPYSTMGYLITREGAQKIIDQSLPISSIADWPIDLSKIWTYATFPRIIDHPRSSNVDSDIRSECIKNKRTAINQIRFNIRYYILLKILNWRFYYRKLFGILVD
jgi:glycosyl transferase family 25